MKKKIILDLDHTLICTCPQDILQIIIDDIDSIPLKKHHYEDCFVFERPHLQEFLDFLFENFDVSIFTAAMEDYASFVVEKIIIGDNKTRKIDFFLSSIDADICYNKYQKHKCLEYITELAHKDSKGLEYSLNNMLIIDDNLFVIDSNRDNCIAAPAFDVILLQVSSEVGQYYFINIACFEDTFLKDVINNLKNKML